ncbi:MAG TPA: response regulator [Burkholderiales bacterium]|nr:response regulator [Burkholderiales bacterium]
MTVEPSVRILIVDDEAAQMKALCDTLRDHGYEPVGFSSGQAALAALRETKFHLLLSDLMMPEMDGIALLQAAVKTDPYLVSIIMTGQGTIPTAVEALKAGAFDYILKPFKLSFVLPVLSRALAMRQLRLENVELEQRVRERSAELEIANKELEAFAHSVSHDLRSPLAAIDGFAQILDEDFRDPLGDDGHRFVTMMRREAKRMNQLIEGLLAFSLLGRRAMNFGEIDMEMLVDDLIFAQHTEVAQTKTSIRHASLPKIWGDSTLLRQVWINLISNALKYSSKRQSPMIEIGCRAEPLRDVFYIKDNGAGFDMSNYDKLFGVFHRLHNAEDFPGTGIGLSLVQRIIMRHGGTVWAEGVVDAGATFYFSIPRKESDRSD